MINPKFYPFYIALGLSVVFFIVYILLSNQGLILSLEPNESIGDISRWCERVSGGIFREPSNALSNIGFMILGLLMFWFLGKDIKSSNSNQFTGINSISILYAGALSGGIAFTLQMFAQKNIEEAPAAIIYSLEGVFAAIAGWIILNQFLTTNNMIGCFLILVAVISSQISPSTKT